MICQALIAMSFKVDGGQISDIGIISLIIGTS
jgi:hypothetical protein